MTFQVGSDWQEGASFTFQEQNAPDRRDREGTAAVWGRTVPSRGRREALGLEVPCPSYVLSANSNLEKCACLPRQEAPVDCNFTILKPDCLS